MCVPLDRRRPGLDGVGAKWRREVPPPRRLTAREQYLPWAVLSFPSRCRRVNHSAPAVGTLAARRCLLKGCERWFLPHRPQARYCSPACQKAARRWRRWHASQRYRATTNGKQHRRDQARRYRNRAQQSLPLPEPAASDTRSRAESLPWSMRSRPPPIRHRRLPSPPTARASAQPKFRKIPAACLATARLLRPFPPCAAVSSSKNSVPARVARRYGEFDSGKPDSDCRRRLGCRPRHRCHRGPPQLGSVHVVTY